MRQHIDGSRGLKPRAALYLKSPPQPTTTTHAASRGWGPDRLPATGSVAIAPRLQRVLVGSILLSRKQWRQRPEITTRAQVRAVVYNAEKRRPPNSPKFLRELFGGSRRDARNVIATEWDTLGPVGAALAHARPDISVTKLTSAIAIVLQAAGLRSPGRRFVSGGLPAEASRRGVFQQVASTSIVAAPRCLAPGAKQLRRELVAEDLHIFTCLPVLVLEECFPPMRCALFVYAAAKWEKKPTPATSYTACGRLLDGVRVTSREW